MNILIVDDEQFAIQGMLDGITWVNPDKYIFWTEK